jgi:crotonobetainyl-CoA:carnitine CoA-transferase CaiB-like acyl-CoA transferase
LATGILESQYLSHQLRSRKTKKKNIMTEDRKPMILEGIRVIDFTLAHMGPAAGAMLADLGAEVIHVEEPGKGDMMRGLFKMLGVSMNLPEGRHALFEDLNRNKQGIAVDLQNPMGKEIIYRLVETADVFLTNYRMKAVTKLQMDPQTLRKHNPRLIFAHGSIMGRHGPDSGQPGLEPIAYARSGVMTTTGNKKEAGPCYLAPGLGDRMGGVYIAYGIMAALLARERSGIVQEVYGSQLGALVSVGSFSAMASLLSGSDTEPYEREKVDNPLFNWYRCKDGKWLMLGLLQSQRYWPDFCKAISRPELEDDPRFRDNDVRTENANELRRLLDIVFSTRPVEQWEAVLSSHDLLMARINEPGDLKSDPQVLANQYLIDVDHAVLGRKTVVGFPLEFTETPMSFRRIAPELGEHTEAVLLSLGYSWEDIGKLKEEEVIP